VNQKNSKRNGMLHIHCGDVAAEIMRASLIPGDILIWREIYLEGPVSGNLSDSEFRKSRALFLSSFGFSYYEILEAVEMMYQRLSYAGKYREIVLWFDACMFDQTILIHVLDRLSRLNLKDTTVTQVNVSGRGLGEFSSSEMFSLFDGRRKVTRQEYFVASEAWRAFSSHDPRDIELFLKLEFTGLPYLKAALQRHLKQYPATVNGLNLLQKRALKSVAYGINKLSPLFKHVSAMEKERFLGDTSFWACLDEMAECAYPALKIEGPERLKRPITDHLTALDRWTIDITPFGHKLLENNCDWIVKNGIDRWLGGVHLLGKEQIWRLDETTGNLVKNA
jgi:hypothetical protein